MVPECVVKARAYLARRFPFLASGLFALPVVEDPTIPTAGIDTRYRLLINTEWFETLTVEEAAGVLYHELLHILYDHFKRRGSRDLEVWNIASDLEINDSILQEEGLDLPEGALIPGQGLFSWLEPGHLAEEYYELLPKVKDQNRGGSGDGGGEQGQDPDPSKLPGTMVQGDGQGEGLSDSEVEVIRKRVAEAVSEAASRRPGSVPGNLERWARGLLQPRIPWEKVLASLFRGALLRARGRQDYRLDGRNRRQALSPVVLPRLRAPEPRILVLIDTSGSVSDQELGLALGEIAGIVRAFGVPVDVGSGDTELQTFQRGILRPDRVKVVGGGGTDLGKILEDLSQKGSWDVVVVLTDGWSPWPPSNPMPRATVLVVSWGEPGPSWAKTVLVKKEEGGRK